MFRRIVVGLLLYLCTVAWSQNAAKPLTLIKAGRLFDAHSGRLLANQAILIEGDRIKEVGDVGGVAAHAAGARTIDLSSATVLPGLIDAHNHVLGNPKDLSPIGDLRMSSAQAALWGARNLRIWLDHGFTTVRDACEPDPTTPRLRCATVCRRAWFQGRAWSRLEVVYR